MAHRLGGGDQAVVLRHIETRSPAMESIRADARLPRPARAAARWWLNIPAHVHASAAR